MDEVSTGAVIEMKCHCTATFLTHHNQGHFWVVASNVFYFDLSFYYSGMLGSEKKKENWEIIALWSVMEDDKSSVLTFVLGYSASMTTSIEILFQEF